jgi:hypothetical protein
MQTYLDAHNTARAKHGAPPLAWSTEMGTFAQNWASQCKWDHSDGPYAGMFLSRSFSLVLFPTTFLRKHGRRHRCLCIPGCHEYVDGRSM